MIKQILTVIFLVLALPIILVGAVVKVFWSTFLFGFYLADLIVYSDGDNKFTQVWRAWK